MDTRMKVYDLHRLSIHNHRPEFVQYFQKSDPTKLEELTFGNKNQNSSRICQGNIIPCEGMLNKLHSTPFIW